jgi:hypothetical protein
MNRQTHEFRLANRIRVMKMAFNSGMQWDVNAKRMVELKADLAGKLAGEAFHYARKVVAIRKRKATLAAKRGA